MTSLFICYPDIPYNAKTITASATENPLQPARNLTAGPRAHGYSLNAAGTTLTLDWDLGSDYATKQNTVNYVAIARADKLQAAGMTQLLIRSSPDNSVWTTRITDASFASATLYGPRADDYIQTITVTSAFRYWRADYTTASSKLPHSKLYFGTYFDWGRDPQYKIERAPASTEFFNSSSGSQRGERIDEPVYRFDFKWTGVTEAKIQSFCAYFGRSYFKENGVFLYTSADHQILDSQRLVHCRMINPTCRKIWNNYYEVNITFEEMRG